MAIKLISKHRRNLKSIIIHSALISLVLTIFLEAFVIGMIQLGRNLVKQESASVISNNMEQRTNNEWKTNVIMNTNIKITDLDEQQEDKDNTHIILLIVALVCGAVIYTCIFLLLLQNRYEYFVNIKEGIDKIIEGDYTSRILVKNKDELSDIASKLNQILDNVQTMMIKQKENEDSKNYLITSVAHDLRTPLTSIIGYMDLIRMDQIIDINKKKEYLDIAYNKSKRLQSLIEDLFTYSQFSFGKVEIHTCEIDMVKFIEQIAEEFFPSFQQNQLEYHFETSEQNALISGDGDLLARAFANLYSNAVKYGKEGKKIETFLEIKDSKIVIRIVNYGKLIPKEDIEHIFERFYRVDSSRSGETGGTGLGLAIAKNIVNMHGGTITAKSDIGGTIFTVFFNI